MQPDDVAGLTRRQWADQEGRLDYWADRYRADGPAAAPHAAAALLEHARTIGSTIFSAEYQAQDFAHHQHMRALLDRAARAITHR